MNTMKMKTTIENIMPHVELMTSTEKQEISKLAEEIVAGGHKEQIERLKERSGVNVNESRS